MGATITKLATWLWTPIETSSWSGLETTKGSHLYRVKGYSLLKGLGPGKFITSNKFKVGGYAWAIRFYPNGFNPQDNSDCVDVSIQSLNDANVRASAGGTFLAHTNGIPNNIPDLADVRFEEHLTFESNEIKCNQSSYKISELETSNQLNNDTLMIYCAIEVIKDTSSECPSEFRVNVPPSDLVNCLTGILDSGIGSDVVFEIEGEIFKAHKNILAARSPVFFAQFFGLIENHKMTHKVVVEEMDPSIFEAMLFFIYSDLLPDLQDLKRTPSCSSITFAQHLLAAADRYGLHRLRFLCEEKLIEEATADTVATTLILAERHSCSQLKSFCLKFASSYTNLGVVMHSKGYEDLQNAFPGVISELLRSVALNSGFPC